MGKYLLGMFPIKLKEVSHFLIHLDKMVGPVLFYINLQKKKKLNLLDDRSVVLIFFSYLSENLPNVNRHENLVPLSSNNT